MARHAHTRQLIALLLTSVMILVHAIKILHTHSSTGISRHSTQTAIISEGNFHEPCAICEFQLAKDAAYTGEILMVIAPVYTSGIYARLLTSINSDRLFITESRGPPQA